MSGFGAFVETVYWSVSALVVVFLGAALALLVTRRPSRAGRRPIVRVMLIVAWVGLLFLVWAPADVVAYAAPHPRGLVTGTRILFGATGWLALDHAEAGPLAGAGLGSIDATIRPDGIVTAVIATLFVAVVVPWAGRRLALAFRVRGRRCDACGYDLRGLPALRCPECGHDDGAA